MSYPKRINPKVGKKIIAECMAGIIKLVKKIKSQNNVDRVNYREIR